MPCTHFILLDGSYFVFFRYHAMRRWWKHARKEDEPESPLESPRYRTSFKNTFSKRLQLLGKLVGYRKGEENLVTIVARDCPSGSCWRKFVCPSYKATRSRDEDVSAHFKFIEDEGLFDHPGVQAALSYPGLEGDDCIALTVADIQRNHPGSRISIVSSDGDFKQLLGADARLIDLKGKIVGGAEAPVDPERELFCKVVAGDSSDNISPVMPRCGRKTAEKYFDHPELWEAKIKDNPDAAGAYARNRLLVDFRFVPEPLQAGFRRECLKALS